MKVALLENRAGHFVGPTRTASAAALADAELPDNMRLYVPDPAGTRRVSDRDAHLDSALPHYRDARKRQTLHDLFGWCLTDGQQYAADLGYVPLPPGIVAAIARGARRGNGFALNQRQKKR